MNIFEQVKTNQFPQKNGWYHTDRNELYWFLDEQKWSCRDDYVSEEYPKFWYKNYAKEIKQLQERNNELFEKHEALNDSSFNRGYNDSLKIQELTKQNEELIEASNKLLDETYALYDFCIDRKYLTQEDVIDGQKQFLDRMADMNKITKILDAMAEMNRVIKNSALKKDKE